MAISHKALHQVLLIKRFVGVEIGICFQDADDISVMVTFHNDGLPYMA